MLRKVSVALLLAIATITIAVPVLAAYYINIDVEESNGTDYDMLAMNMTLDVDYLASHQFIAEDGTDVRVKTSQGATVPFMLAEDKLLFASAITGDKTNGFQLTTGNSALSSFPVIAGHGGYVTITDHDNLELGEDFELEWSGYVDTTVADHLLYKDGAFDLASDGAGHITATITKQPNVSQTQVDTHQSLYAGSATRFGERFNTVETTTITQVSFKLAKFGSPTGNFYVRVRAVSDDSVIDTIATVDISTLTVPSAWYDYSCSVWSGSTQDIRICCEYSGGDASNYFRVGYEEANHISDGLKTTYTGSWADHAYDATIKVTFAAAPVLTADVSAGDYIFQVATDDTEVVLLVDGAEEDRTDRAGVIANANNWVLGSDATPYFNYYQHTTSDTLRLTYEPDDIISGTTLPNEENPGTYDGAITWGSNPAGIDITCSTLQLEEGYYPTGGATNPTDIFEPEPVELISGLNLERLSHNPLAPLVESIVAASNSNLTESLVWIGGAWFILIAAVIFLFIKMREHLMFAAFAGCGLSIMFYVMGIFGYWVIIIFGIGAIAAIVHERQPQW